MSCYHPMIAVKDGLTASGKNHYKFYANYAGTDREEKAKYPDDQTMIIPCGRCIGCRLDKSRQWADRMLLELDHCKKACFVTLTYRPESIGVCQVSSNLDGTPNYSILKDHMQQFMKTLRSRVQFEDKEIRFFGCGEYGSKGRPHYHLILFGISKEDFGVIVPVKRNEFGDLYYHSDLLEDIWKYGMCCLCDVSWKTMAYVSRYVTKKMTGDLSSFYSSIGISPEFALMSRRPGIAGYYLQDHPDFDFKTTKITLSDQDGSKTVSVPDYIFKDLEFLDLDLYNEIKASRLKYAEDREYLKMMSTDLDIENVYFNEEEAKLNQFSRLLRSYEKCEENLY